MFQVIYDGNGKIIKWIIVTTGSVLPDDMTVPGMDNIMFLKSPSGSLTETVVRNTMITVKR